MSFDGAGLLADIYYACTLPLKCIGIFLFLSMFCSVYTWLYET